jgi:hypothetical protein
VPELWLMHFDTATRRAGGKTLVSARLWFGALQPFDPSLRVVCRAASSTGREARVLRRSLSFPFATCTWSLPAGRRRMVKGMVQLQTKTSTLQRSFTKRY